MHTQAPAGAEKEADQAGREEGDTGTIKETNQAQAECDFDELKLDEAHEKAIENLREEEEVLVLMPAKEFVIAHGPKRTVLYWLCGDAEMTVKINDFLEGELISYKLVGICITVVPSQLHMGIQV